jgi:hypothetical protein
VKLALTFSLSSGGIWANEKIADSQGIDGTFAFQLFHLLVMAGQFFEAFEARAIVILTNPGE